MKLINKDTKIYPGDFIKYIKINDNKHIGYGFFVKKIIHEKYPETKSLFLLKNDKFFFKIKCCHYLIYHESQNPRNNFKHIIHFVSENYTNK